MKCRLKTYKKLQETKSLYKYSNSVSPGETQCVCWSVQPLWPRQLTSASLTSVHQRHLQWCRFLPLQRPGCFHERSQFERESQDHRVCHIENASKNSAHGCSCFLFSQNILQRLGPFPQTPSSPQVCRRKWPFDPTSGYRPQTNRHFGRSRAQITCQLVVLMDWLLKV